MVIASFYNVRGLLSCATASTSYWLLALLRNIVLSVCYEKSDGFLVLVQSRRSRALWKAEKKANSAMLSIIGQFFIFLPKMPVKVFRKKPNQEAYVGNLRISTYVSLKSRYLSF